MEKPKPPPNRKIKDVGGGGEMGVGIFVILALLSFFFWRIMS